MLFIAVVVLIAALGEARQRAGRALVAASSERAAVFADTAARIAQGEQTAREQANAAIAASERSFRTLIAHSADAFVLLDGGGAIRFASPATSRLLGSDFAQEGGANLAPLVHREDAPQFRTLLAEAGRATLRLWAGDGWRWVEATGSDLRDDPDVRALLVNLHDITARVRIEARDAFLRDAAHRLVNERGDADALAAVAEVAVPRFAAGCAVELTADGTALRRAFTDLPPDLPPDAPDPFAVAGVSAHVVRALVTKRVSLFAPAPDAPATMLVAPLVAWGKPLGAVTFMAGERGAFDADDETTATLFAGYLALALVSVRL